jgi:uncharacterized circularly permuted ATP-grasp superfamily protein
MSIDGTGLFGTTRETPVASRPMPWDELLTAEGSPRPGAEMLARHLQRVTQAELQARQDQVDIDILTSGITFTVYADGRGIDRAWPCDVIPRVIAGHEWDQIEGGLKQRLRALNAFIDDVYNDQLVIADGVFPAELLEASVHFRPECRGMKPAFGVWAHICGTDLVRDGEGVFRVLEDNLRVPSGVSYLLENRLIAKRAMGDLFRQQSIRPVDDYPDALLGVLRSIAPEGVDDPTVVVLTPGVFNSAYFEHSFLARRMGIPLVEGSDLVVRNHRVYVRTIDGMRPVHVIYRRVDDVFLDPSVFRPDSTLGVPGLMGAWRAGHVAIANAPGAGVADDKVVYAWVPEFIKYYLGEDALLPSVPTYRCMYTDERQYVLDNMEQLVVKPANESGGYGLCIGDRATPSELAAARASIVADPRNWVAQPILALSTVPTLTEDGIDGRHVDLRPFVLSAETQYVTRGGLTRVARPKGSLVVNSSQGGGSKDTWIVDSLSIQLPPESVGV